MNAIELFGKNNGTNISPLSCISTDVLRQGNIERITIEYCSYAILKEKTFNGCVCFSKGGTKLRQEFFGSNLADVAKQVQDFCMAIEP